MNESLLEVLTKVTLYDLILALSLLIVILGILASQKKRILKFLNKWRKDKNEEEDLYATVYELKNSVSELQKAVKEQSESIKTLTATTLEIQKKNSKTKRAEIKEKIERIYSECHPTKTCTDMQFETLKELIEEYEEHGGLNSFVHSTVEPEMYEWEKITRIRKPTE